MCNDDVYLIYTKIFANYYYFSHAKFDVRMQIKSHEMHNANISRNHAFSKREFKH